MSASDQDPQSVSSPSAPGRELTERNAVIKNARISLNDRDLLDCMLELDYGGSGQCFGGYTLHLGPGYAHHNKSKLGPNYAGVFIERVLRMAGVDGWHQLPGRTVRVRHEHSKVHAIGHIVKDEWFNPSEEFKAMAAARSDSEERTERSEAQNDPDN